MYSSSGVLKELSSFQRPPRAELRNSCTARAAVGIFYATQTGNTETVASKLAEATGLKILQLPPIALARISEPVTATFVEYSGSLCFRVLA